MRAVKRAVRRLWGEYAIAPRKRAVAEDIRRALGLAQAPALTPSGSRGHDGIYLVSDAGKTFGVLRLLNPALQRKAKSSAMPFVSLPPEERIAHERAAYARGHAAGLTPEPLWSAQDALLCAYLPVKPLHARLLARPEEAWDLVLAASRALRGLHALGIVHADASLANTLADDALLRLAFVDFEYAPAAHITPAGARLYDYLRMLESTWKFIPADRRGDCAAWLEFMKDAVTPDMTQVDLDALLPALERISAQPFFARLRAMLAG
jgi:hypothetical protein